MAARLRAKPGVTGLWQVSGRHELAFEDYIRYDLFYVENWSLALDLQIIARTVPAIISRAGALLNLPLPGERVGERGALLG